MPVVMCAGTFLALAIVWQPSEVRSYAAGPGERLGPGSIVRLGHSEILPAPKERFVDSYWTPRQVGILYCGPGKMTCFVARISNGAR